MPQTPPIPQHQHMLAILDGLNAMVYVSDMDSYEILFTNRYCREIFGHIEGKICWQTIQQGQSGPCPFCTNDKLLLEDGSPGPPHHWEFENTFTGKWFELYDQAIEWVDGRIVRLEIATDITTRKEHELVLKRRERAFLVLSKCNDAMIHAEKEQELLKNICQIIVETGQYRMAWVGYAENDKQKSVIPIAQVGDRDNYLQNIHISWADIPSGHGPTGTAIRTGQTVVCKDILNDPKFLVWREEASKRKYGSSIALPLQENNKSLGALTLYSSEKDAFDPEEVTLLEELAGNLAYGITTIRTKENLNVAIEQLTVTNEQLAMLVESLPIMPFTQESTEPHAITYMSPTVKEITGYTPKQFINDSTFWFNRIHPDDQQRFLAEIRDLLSSRRRQTGEFRFLVADDSYHWFRSHRRLVSKKKTGTLHIVGAWLDITEEKKLQQEAELNLQQALHADKLASLGEVVAGVAHEINNPNSFISYNVPLLEETWQFFKPIIDEYSSSHPEWQQGGMTLEELSQDMEDIIDALGTGSSRINKIVGSLKNFARLDSSPTSEMVQVNNVVEDTVIIVGAQARKLVSKVELVLADNLPEIHGSFQKLEQVVANLVMNGAHAVTDKEGGRLTITTRFIKRLDAVLIEVEDNGIGISESEREKIFDPFYTTKRTKGGTGLGLSISYGLVQEHNGKIAVLSHTGRGTKFTTFLPRDRRQGIQDIFPTILCVDDDPHILNFFTSYFAMAQDLAGATLHGPDEVIAYLEEHPEVDVVLCDVKMPKIDGWQLLNKIKSRWPLLTVVLNSGHKEHLTNTASRHQPDLTLTKPFPVSDFNVIFEKINRLTL